MSIMSEAPTFEEFQATRKRCTYRDLITDGSEPAASMAVIEPIDTLNESKEEIKRILDKPILAYTLSESDTDPNLFIEIEPNGDYYLVIGNTEATATNDEELRELEQTLYEWGLAENFGIDLDEEPERGPSLG
jgi:hypothetical protein